MRKGKPLKLFNIRSNFSSFSLAKSQPRDLQIMVYSCAMSPNFPWRQIIFCCRVYETTLFSFLLSQSCVKMADRFASQRYSLKIKLGDRTIKHQYWTQLSQNILMMNQVVHGKGQRNERRLQGRGLKAWVAHLYWNFQQYPRGPFTNYDSKWFHRKTITDLPRLRGLFSSWQASFVFPSL